MSEMHSIGACARLAAADGLPLHSPGRSSGSLVSTMIDERARQQ